MKTKFPRNLHFKETTTGRQGHEETRKQLEVSVTEEEEVSAERGTEESQPMSEAGFTVRIETEFTSTGTLPEDDSTTDQRNSRKDTDSPAPKPQGNPQNVSLLPSFFVAPICTEIPGSPPYRVIPLKKEIIKPRGVSPKKETRSDGVQVFTTLENSKCMPEGTPILIARPKCRSPRSRETQRPRSHKKTKANAGTRMQSPPMQRPSTEPPPGPRTPRPFPEPSQRKSAEQLAENAGDRGEVKEKLVYVVEERGKNVTKVETDLFSLHEILTIKKDLLELSEFAKKLKQLKEKNKPQESAKVENGGCRCEPVAQILKDVNKKIEALEKRQEELEKGGKNKEESAIKKTKTPSNIHPEPARPTVNVVFPAQPKTNAMATRRGPPAVSSATDLVNELMDIKEQLKRLEERRCPQPDPEEMPVEWVDGSELGRTVWTSTALTKDVCSRKVKPKKKDGAIAVFSSKTYIFSPDKLGNDKRERMGTGNRGLGDKIGFEEAKIINWLKGVCSGGSDFKVLLKPSPTIMEESLEGGKVEFTCKNCSRPLDEMGDLRNQTSTSPPALPPASASPPLSLSHSPQTPTEPKEPQKNRATHKDPRQDDFLKKESSSNKVLKKRSYKECFVSPSGKFFAWMKRSSDKVMRNFCSDWPQTKVLKKVHPKQISRTTSTGSIVSLVRESPPRALRCSVKSEISLSGNLQDFVRVICKSEKTAMNESVKCLGKKGRRSLSRDKLQKEDKNEAVRRREPRWVRPKRNSDTSLSSSFSEIMETMDFDMTSNSVDGARWQRSNEFHAQVFSCFAQPDYMLDTSKHRRTEWFRETDKQRRRREKRERKAEKRMEKKAAKMRKECEKQRRKLAKKEEKYASRCIVEGCDYGKDYWRNHSPTKLPQTTEEDSKDTSGEPYRPMVYKKEEYAPIKQSHESNRYGGKNHREDKKLQQEEDSEECTCSDSSEESLEEPRGSPPERKRSELLADRASYERNTLREFFKTFGAIYPRLEELCKELPEKKKVGLEERQTKDVKRRREKEEMPTVEENNRGSKSSISGGDPRHGNRPHNHDLDQVENCDCVRLFLECEVEKKLEALKNAQLSSKESSASVSSKSSKQEERKPKSGKHKKKEHPKNEARGRKAEHHKKKDFEDQKYEESVPKPENLYEDDSRIHQQPPPVPEGQKKQQSAMKKEKKVNGHPKKNKKKVRHRNERYCHYCGTAPCLIEGDHDIGKPKESSASTQQECATPPPEGASSPKKDQRKPHFREPKENSAFLSYLSRFWRNKNGQPNTSATPAEIKRQRGRVKRRCSKCAAKRRNVDNSIWRLEARRFPPEICIFRDDTLQPDKTGGRPRGRMSNHRPTHSHCFLINENHDNCCRADSVCCPEDRRLDHRCRHSGGNRRRRDHAIDCHYFRDNQEWTETEDTRTDSGERINRKNLKDRLASLHFLWRNLRKCTMQKAMLGRQVGRCIRRSLSGLDSYDCWWSDTWPKPRQQRHHGGRHRNC